MSERPWFALARGIFDHPRFAGGELCDLSCFAWLVSRARYQDGEDIRRGQLIVTVPELVEAWGWTNRGKRPAEAVRRLLRKWSDGDDPAITTEPVSNGGRTVGTLVTILRYDDWQRPANESLRGCRATHNATHKPTHQATHNATHNATPSDVGGSEQIAKAVDAPPDASPDAPRDASPDAPRDTLLFNRHERHVRHEQQRAHAREDAAAADPILCPGRLTWAAVRDLWAETWRMRYERGEPNGIGGSNCPVQALTGRMQQTAADSTLQDAWDDAAAVLEAFVYDDDPWLRTNQHPLPYLLKHWSKYDRPRAMTSIDEARMVGAHVESHSHHVAQSEAAPTSTTPEQAAQSRSHHVAAEPQRYVVPDDPGPLWGPMRAKLRAELGDEFAGVELAHARGNRITLFHEDEMRALVLAKRYRRAVEKCAEMVTGAPWVVEIVHGAVEREQRGAA